MSDYSESVLIESVLVKILTGPHEGAEIPLGCGRFVVGNSFECDIVIRDTLIESRHFELIVEPERCFVRPIAGKTLVDQSPVEAAECEVAYYQSLTLGSTRLMLGPVDEPWVLPQEDRAPKVQPVEKSKPEERKESTVSHRPRSNHRFVKALFLLLALSGCIGVAMWAAFNFTDQGNGSRKPAASVAEAGQKDLAAQLRKLPFAADLRVEQRDGRTIITGYVPSRQDRLQLRSLAQQFNPLSLVRAIADDELLSETRMLVQSQVSQLALATEAPGRIAVSGIVEARENWENLRRRLLDDIRGLNEVDDAKVYSASDVTSKLEDFLERNGFNGKLRVVVNYPSFSLAGKLNPRERDSWEKLRTRIPELFDFPIVVTSEISSTGDGGDIIENVTIDTLRWVTLRNGRRLFEGSLLPGGYRVRDIESDGALVSRSGESGHLVKIGEPL